MTRSMCPTSSERTGRALDVGPHRRQRAAYHHANRNGKSSVGMLDTVRAATGDTTNVRSDRRPADQERHTSGRQPEALSEIYPQDALRHAFTAHSQRPANRRDMRWPQRPGPHWAEDRTRGLPIARCVHGDHACRRRVPAFRKSRTRNRPHSHPSACHRWGKAVALRLERGQAVGRLAGRQPGAGGTVRADGRTLIRVA